MKKTVMAICLISVICFSMFSCSFNNSEEYTTVQETETTELLTTTEPVKPTLEDGSNDYSYFDNCAFLGNSRFLALGEYGLVKNCYAAVGLTVESVFTKSLPGSDVPVIDELDNASYDKVFILFGDNECGWPNHDVFREKYETVIKSVMEKQPNAKIFATSVLPVSDYASNNNKYGVTNENIDRTNEAIKLAAENCGIDYLDPGSIMKNNDGALPDDAASDGIHMTKEYCVKWVDYFYENT